MGLGFLCSVAFFGVSAHSLAFPGPKPTADAHFDVPALPEDGWSPKPTAVPSAHDVLRRQSPSYSTYFAFQDNVCGYVNLDRHDLDPYSCGSSASCAFLPSSPGSPGAVGCCEGGDCSFRMGCMDHDDLKSCNEDCMGNDEILKCSRSNARFCHTAVYPGGTTDFLCASRRPRGLLIAQLSTPGQKARTLTKFVISPPSSSTTQQSSTRTHSSRTSDKPTSTSSTSVRDSGLAAKPENTSKSSSSSSYSSPSSSSSTVDTAPAASSSVVVSPTPAQESSNTGAIAGGVVGGLAGLGLVIFAVFFFLRRKKTQDTQDTQPRAAPSLDGQKPLVTANSLRASAPSPSPSNPFSDPPQDSARQDASFSQLANAFPSVPEPLNLSKTSLLSPTKRAVTPTQLSPLSAVTIVAVKAMPDPEKALVVYPEPSPMSTPSGSPRSAYRTPDATSFYPNYPQYRPPSSRSQSGLQSGWPTSPITREGNVSPVSTFPVSPVSPLGPNRPNKDIAVPDFPLVLQPGMGMQRLAPGTVKQVTLQRGASRRNQNPKAEGSSQSSTDGEEKPSSQQNAND